jgi:hypothetical protein
MFFEGPARTMGDGEQAAAVGARSDIGRPTIGDRLALGRIAEVLRAGIFRRKLLFCCFLAWIAGEAALLDHLSLSNDELFSIYFAKLGPAYLFGEGWRLETNPPLYYLLLDFWMALFGQSAVSVRVPSLLAVAATAPVLWRIARRLGLDRGAWLAPALFLTSALAQRYALMARGYSLWLLVLALALLALVEAVAASPDRPGPARRWRWAPLFAGAGLLALYLHDTTIVFLAAANSVFLGVWLLRRPFQGRALALWVLPQLLVIPAELPQLLVIWAQRHSQNINWMPPVTGGTVLEAAISLVSGHEYPIDIPQLASLVVTALIVLVLAPLLAPRPLRPLAGLVIAAVLLLAALDLPVARTALWLLLPLALIEAAALLRLRQGWVIAGVLALGALNTGNCLWAYDLEPWDKCLAEFEAARGPKDAVILFNAVPATAFHYYHADDGAGFYRWDVSPPFDRPGTALRTIDDMIKPLPQIGYPGFRALVRRGDPVWLVARLPVHAMTAQYAAQGLKTTRFPGNCSALFLRVTAAP